jgi:hypothetical protein
MASLLGEGASGSLPDTSAQQRFHAEYGEIMACHPNGGMP